MHADDPNVIGVLTLGLPSIASDWDRHGVKVNTRVEGEVIVVGLDTEQKRELVVELEVDDARSGLRKPGPWRDYWNMRSAESPTTSITCRGQIQLT